jgi:hypothetical protein
MIRRSLLAATLLMALGFSPLTWAQGCSLCRDTAAGSTPQMRRALRIAIPLLGIPAAGIFVGILALARRIDPKP